MHRIRTLAPLAATLAIASFGLAACGSDSDDTASTAASNDAPATSAPAAETPKGPAIKVGMIGSLTGPLAGSLGRSGDVIKAWESATNAAGGINGHPVEVSVVDDGQNPARGLAGVKKLIEQDKVIAIVGQMSLVSTAWEKYASSKGVPVVGGQPVDTPFITNPMFFASGSTLPAQLFGVVSLAADAGKKKLGVMYCAETPVCGQLVPIISGLGKQVGVTVAGQKISSTAANHTAPCLALKGKGVDALFVAVNSSGVPRVVASCAKQGYKPFSVATSSTVDKAWLSEKGLDGTVISSTNAVYTDTSVPGVKKFNDALATYAPGLQESNEFSYPLIYPWSGGELFAAAAKAAGLTPDSTPADVLRGLYALKDETLEGVAPPLNFVEGKPGFSPCFFSAKQSDGAFVTTDGNTPTCLPAAEAAKLAAAFGG